MNQNHAPLEAGQPAAEPGMNLISSDFELIMVNRANERLFGKSAGSLVGKKCYQEFEHRDQPCPHCPGRRALETGETHETEAEAWHSDGTRVYARIRAHPVVGPDNRPTGFVEVVEDLTEQKRAESLAAIEARLQTALSTAKNVQRALREALEAALLIECLDWGCVFLVDHPSGQHMLLLERGTPPVRVDSDRRVELVERRATEPQTENVPGVSYVVETVPILHRGQLVATLLAGATTCRMIPVTLRAGLRSLGVIASNAVSRIIAEQSRGDAIADLETFISIAPLATWVLDDEDHVTLWNKAAETLFGWPASEVLGRAVPFGPAHLEQQPQRLAGRDGTLRQVRLVAAPFRDVVGNGSTTLVMAEPLSPAPTFAAAGDAPPAAPASAPADRKSASETDRVLVMDAGEPWGAQLADMLTDLGYAPARYASALEAGRILAGAQNGRRPFALAVVAMIYSDGSTGLDQKAALRELGFVGPVVVSSDAGVYGHEHYGIAAVVTYPYDRKAVARAFRQALLHATN
jgi:PAS domain S-box-containing protein